MNDIDTSEELFRLNPFMSLLRRELSTLAVQRQAAFALLCCELLYPYYVAFAEKMRTTEAIALRELLDDLWKAVQSGGIEPEQVAEFLGRLNMINLQEEGSCEEWDGAVDAIGAVSLALHLWIDDVSENAAKAAFNVLNRVHQRQMDEVVGTTYSLTADEMLKIAQRIDESLAMKALQDRLLNTVRMLRETPHLDVERIQSWTPTSI